MSARRPTDLLTVAQVAEQLQCSSGTVEQLARSGRLPAFKLGRLWRIRRQDLEAFCQPSNLEVAS